MIHYNLPTDSLRIGDVVTQEYVIQANGDRLKATREVEVEAIDQTLIWHRGHKVLAIVLHGTTPGPEGPRGVHLAASRCTRWTKVAR